MRPVFVAGAGMTAFGKHPEATVSSLSEAATQGALQDAGLGPDVVGTVMFSNAIEGVMTGQEMIRGQVALRNTGLLGTQIVNVENACASASTAFHLAWMAVASGAVEVALAIGAEKMTHPDKARSFGAIGTALDLGSVPALSGRLRHQLLGEGVEDSDAGGDQRSPFMDVYADMTEEYMARSGAGPEAFAEVAVKNRHHASLNPRAQFRDPLTAEEVLASRHIAGPLTLLMCSPIGDGAAAVVLCSEDVGGRLDAPLVRVAASVLLSGRPRAEGEANVAARAAEQAYESAGVDPADLDVLEVHDAAAPAELMLYEDLGLCPPGDGPGLLASGETSLGGRRPVNPSGGLLSKGHPIGATGCGQLVELVDQLRGRGGDRQVPGARVALAENGGGFIGDDAAAASVTILAREA